MRWLLLALVLNGCGSESEAAPQDVAPAPEVEVSRTEAPAEEMSGEAASAAEREGQEPSPRRLVVESRFELGRHREFLGRSARPGPWAVAGLAPEPGEESVEVLGQTLTDCRRSAVEDGQVVWCPSLGVVETRVRQRGATTWDRLVAIERGGVVHAESTCVVDELLDEALLAETCAVPLRTLGVPRPTEADGCTWRFVRDGPHEGQPRHADMTLRLERDIAAVEQWAGVASGESATEARGLRTELARAGPWAAAVQVRGETCGAGELGALAEALAGLGPSPLPDANPR